MHNLYLMLKEVPQQSHGPDPCTYPHQQQPLQEHRLCKRSLPPVWICMAAYAVHSSCEMLQMAFLLLASKAKRTLGPKETYTVAV